MAKQVRCGEMKNHEPHDWGIKNGLHCDGQVRALDEILASHMEARDELRAEADAVRRAMEADVLPKNSVHWTGEFKRVNEDGDVVDYDDMDITTWYQYRDESGLEMWAAFVGDSYMMQDGEW